MHKLYKILIISAIGLVINIFLSAVSFAIEPSVVISQIKLGDEISAKNEFIEIYNNSEIEIDITNWCVYYQSLSLTSKKLACFVSEDSATHVYLPASSHALIVSNEQTLVESPILGDATFSATLSGIGGYVYLLDNFEAEIDKVGWNVDFESGNFVPTAIPGQIISRKIITLEEPIENAPIMFQDTDLNADDFELSIQRENYLYGQIYELIDLCLNMSDVQSILPDNYYLDEFDDCYEIVDLCPNLEDVQLLIPTGHGINEFGDCVIDVCVNLDGVQSLVPEWFELVGDECFEIDFCPNLDGIQDVIPPGFYQNDLDECMRILILLQLSELLPNIDGVDDGSEFIEIFNPNSFDVSLSNYIFRTDPESEKFYTFSEESTIKANEYYLIYNSETSFTLKNTTSGVWLYMADNQLVDNVSYENPEEDESWALIGDTWAYTNRLTPGIANLEYFIQEVPVKNNDDNEVLTTCGPDQYRNPETNRCKNIISTTTTLVPCKDGQYRSEETNRCRNIVSDVIAYMPCAEGEERNPETNRCRKVVASSVLGETSLVPCAEGEERNPETNRCRKVVSEIPESDYKVEVVETSKGSNIITWSIAGVITLAIMYGVWEWRFEITQIIRKLKDFVSHN